MRFIRQTTIVIPMSYRELQGRTGLLWNRFRERERALRTPKYFKKIRRKRRGKFHKTNHPSQLRESETETGALSQFLWKRKYRASSHSEHGTKSLCCRSLSEASGPHGQLWLASPKCLRRAHLFFHQCLLLALGWLDSFPIVIGVFCY